MSYSLGIDFALGILGKDFDAGVLLDLDGKQIATLHGHWGTDFLPHIVSILQLFGSDRVFVVGEAAKEGIPILRSLYDAGYWVYFHRQQQTRGMQTRDMLGHVPTQWDPTVRRLQEAVKAGQVVVRDETLHTELCRFGFRPRSRATSPEEATDGNLTWGAPPGEHDDLVRALALAHSGIEWLPAFDPPKKRYAPGTMGHLLDLDKDDEPEPTPQSIWQ